MGIGRMHNTAKYNKLSDIYYNNKNKEIEL